MLELLLAVLSASAAAGMRIALPLLVIGLSGNDAWAHVPLLNRVSPPIVLSVLVSWSLVEVFASKNRLGQRVLQVVQLLLSPVVGALMGMTIAQATEVSPWLVGILGGVGGLLAFVLKLVQVGWFYRLRGLPLWLIFVQDALCVCLVVFAFDAPREGGIIALLLLWLAIRSSQAWQRWQNEGRSSKPVQRGSLLNEEARRLRDLN
ncbi:MAG: DUF4126 domain-containing protein [Phormidesmis sp. CAN_BIN36]|nr:DUF4126 domain-containing protein [Phormidesmis sp. CAN_BIN36]